MSTERRPVDPATRPAHVDAPAVDVVEAPGPVDAIVDDLACDLAVLSPDDLVALNTRLGEARSTILHRQRQVTAEIDRRTVAERVRHRAELDALGVTPQRLQL